jgi:ribosomal protein L29
MKVNDKKELHAKESSELRKMLKDGHELLLSLKLDREQNKLKNTRGIFHTRKSIAIIKTILRGKEGQEAPVVVAAAAKKVEVKKEKAAATEKKEAAPSAK